MKRHTRVVPAGQEVVFLEVGTWMGLVPRRLTEFRECRPVLLNRAETQRSLVRAARSLDADLRARMSVWLLVETNGTVGDARVHETSGWLDVDRAMLDVMRGTMFSPAQLEGIPVGVWVQIPVNVDVELPPPPDHPFNPPLQPPLPPPC